MRFEHSELLWLAGLVVALLGWFLIWSWRVRQRLMTRFIQARLLDGLTVRLEPGRERRRRVVLVGVVLLLFLAMARPQWGYQWEEAHRRGLDVLVAVDTSRSMLATDLQPSRLERAKLAARDLMRMNEGDRMGLVAFAGTAFLQCPLTLDEQAFRQSLSAVDTRIIPQGGTALAQAIRVARDAFKDEDNFRVLVLISDGEDHDEGALAEAAKAAEAGMRIFTLGVGTVGGEVLRVVNEAGETEYIKDDGGNVVKSRLNEGLLREVATVGQGFYLPLAAPNAMEVLYEEGLAPLPRSEVSSRLTRRFHERFYWPLGLAILLLMWETVLPRSARLKKLAAVVLAGWFCAGGSVVAAVSAGGAMRAYEEGRYREAMEQYRELAEKDPKDLRLAYNLGTAAYRAGDYGVAAGAFTNALSGADLQLQQKSFYNLGNTLFQMGEGSTDFAEKSARWTQATNNYNAAMQLDPEDTSARDNLLYVSRKLEELQQQQQQQQQQGGDQGDQQEQQDQNQQDQQQRQQGQDQQQDQGQQEQQGDSGEQRQDSQQQQQGEDGQGQQQQSGRGEEDAGQEQQQSGSEGEAGEGEEQEAGASGGAEGEGGEQGGEQREGRVAGQMTAAEARRFLDEQRDGERTMIFLPKGTNRSGVRVLKDW
ncbi:MAG: hypothetical protein RI897_3771 [Verrucomicrobiota bacterium]|jgi:Ca-activated chloride channel family protein